MNQGEMLSMRQKGTHERNNAGMACMHARLLAITAPPRRSRERHGKSTMPMRGRDKFCLRARAVMIDLDGEDAGLQDKAHNPTRCPNHGSHAGGAHVYALLFLHHSLVCPSHPAYALHVHLKKASRSVTHHHLTLSNSSGEDASNTACRRVTWALVAALLL